MTTPILIGIASYGSPEKLAATVASIQKHSVLDYRILIVDNPHPDGPIEIPEGPGIEIVRLEKNVGYAGAVNEILRRAEGGGFEYVIYCDNDISVETPAWDLSLYIVLHSSPECAQVFPGSGHFSFHNGRYQECLWSAGFCWALRVSTLKHPRLRRTEFAPMGMQQIHEVHRACWIDQSLGHHEEVRFNEQLRLCGFTIGCCPDVKVEHHETSTKSEASAKRIHMGVVNWMNDLNKRYVGDAITYPDPALSFEAPTPHPWSAETDYSPRALRFTDMPPFALYMERWTLSQFPGLNANPEVVMTSQGEMDLIKVLKPKGYYRDRAI